MGRTSRATLAVLLSICFLSGCGSDSGRVSSATTPQNTLLVNADKLASIHISGEQILAGEEIGMDITLANRKEGTLRIARDHPNATMFNFYKGGRNMPRYAC
jgi:hypothetical protein